MNHKNSHLTVSPLSWGEKKEDRNRKNCPKYQRPPCINWLNKWPLWESVGSGNWVRPTFMDLSNWWKGRSQSEGTKGYLQVGLHPHLCEERSYASEGELARENWPRHQWLLKSLGFLHLEPQRNLVERSPTLVFLRPWVVSEYAQEKRQSQTCSGSAGRSISSEALSLLPSLDAANTAGLKRHFSGEGRAGQGCLQIPFCSNKTGFQREMKGPLLPHADMAQIGGTCPFPSLSDTGTFLVLCISWLCEVTCVYFTGWPFTVIL